MRRNVSLDNLLIGDWLVDTSKNKPFQVTIEWLNEINELLKKKDSNISPFIFLKTESLSQNILEKNGFKFEEPEFITFSEEKVWVLEIREEQFRIELEYQIDDDDFNECFVARGYYGCAGFELYIDEVWELQRILKFYHIKKEIII